MRTPLAHFRDFSDAFMPSLASHLLSSTLFMLIVLAVLYALRRRITAGARYWLAFLAIMKFALPAEPLVAAMRAIAGSLVRPDFAEPFVAPLAAVGGALHIFAAPEPQAIWPALAATVWIVGAAGIIARFVITQRRLVTLSVRTAAAPEKREIEILARAKRLTGVRRSIDIARASLPEAPAVLRIFRPVIVLPSAGCDGLSDRELEVLLVHECAHVARHDNLLTMIEAFVCGIFWFHPLVWMTQRIALTEREKACDEAVATSVEGRETYMTALRKFCHASIAPRLPGVSCMATASLKERMDYVMEFAALQSKAPSSRRVMSIAITALVAFTLAAGFGRPELAFAGEETRTTKPYAIKLSASSQGDAVMLAATVSENSSGKVIAAPMLSMAPGGEAAANSSTSGAEVSFSARHVSPETMSVDVTITRSGRLLQRHTTEIAVTKGAAAPEKYTGQPINLRLADADLRDLLGTFGDLTGLEIRVDEGVQGKVSVDWQNVPWDEALHSLLQEHDLEYRLEGSTMYVSKK